MDNLIVAAQRALARVRAEQPLVHLITNFVTMAEVANAVLAVGARPVMAHAEEDVAEITPTARALVLNLGTPSRERLDAMLVAARVAREHRIPIVFDPVGVGASTFRRACATRLLDAGGITIVRGNAGEIGALAGVASAMSGVDTLHADYDRARVLTELARAYRVVVVCTGATDWVADGARVVIVENGHPFLKRIAGAGDMLDALIAIAATVESDALLAATCGLLWIGIAAEQAARTSDGIGTFHTRLFDALDALDDATIQRAARVKIL
ncbi:MAG: hydroxyethylthiazole kinase [Anaerolineae bacterium]|nr:hydroxyethylthiazole kinase [Anaerolineae bacterium]